MEYKYLDFKKELEQSRKLAEQKIKITPLKKIATGLFIALLPVSVLLIALLVFFVLLYRLITYPVETYNKIYYTLWQHAWVQKFQDELQATVVKSINQALQQQTVSDNMIDKEVPPGNNLLH
jgi:hypothetical protein